MLVLHQFQGILTARHCIILLQVFYYFKALVYGYQSVQITDILPVATMKIFIFGCYSINGVDMFDKKILYCINHGLYSVHIMTLCIRSVYKESFQFMDIVLLFAVMLWCGQPNI